LSDEQSLGCLRETKQFRYLDEIFQLTQFHTRSISAAKIGFINAKKHRFVLIYLIVAIGNNNHRHFTPSLYGNTFAPFLKN